MQQQFNSFIQFVGILPPCPDDAVRAAKGLGPLDDISTYEESNSVCAAEDANDKDDDDEWQFFYFCMCCSLDLEMACIFYIFVCF